MLLAAVDVFRVFADIARRPDGIGPFVCMMLLTFAYLLSNAVVLAKVVIYAGKGEVVQPPAVSLAGGACRVIAVNATSYRRLGPLGEEHYAALNVLALGYALLSWVTWAFGLWLGLKLVGGPTGQVVVLAGYILSVKVYEHLTRAAILAAYLSGLQRIELFVAPSAQKISSLLNLAAVAFVSAGGLPTALNAHAAFFAVWSIVVSVAAVHQGGFVTPKRSVAGGIAAYLFASLGFTIAYSLLARAL